MKKTVTINISGQVFHIEEDAYETLRAYLDSVQRYFARFEDSGEIVADIESRMAEIFVRRLGTSRQVVTAQDVAHLTATMGAVSDFEAMEDGFDVREGFAADGADAGTQNQSDAGSSGSGNTEDAPPRRLFRDPNSRLIGGVAAGIAHYFRTDPIWVRLLFVASFLDLFILPGSLSVPTVLAYVLLWVLLPVGSPNRVPVRPTEAAPRKFYRSQKHRAIGGVAAGLAAYFGVEVLAIRVLFILSLFLGGAGLLLYVVLWVITPEAKTTTDEMRMRGESVTLANIEANVKKSLNVEDQKEESVFVKILLFPFRLVAAVFRGLSPLLVFLGEALRVLVGGTLVLLAFVVLLGLVLVVSGVYDWLPAGAVRVDDFPLELLRADLTPGRVVALLGFVGIPLLALGLGGVRLIALRSVTNTAVRLTMLGLWLVSFAALAIQLLAFSGQWERYDGQVEVASYPITAQESLFQLQAARRGGRSQRDHDYDQVRLTLVGHAGEGLRLTQTVSTYGRDADESDQFAAMVAYAVTLADSGLVFGDRPIFREGARYRGQRVHLRLEVPYGHPFRMEPELAAILYRTLTPAGYRTRHLADNTWQFSEQNGLRCLTCPEDEATATPLSASEEGGQSVPANLRDFEAIRVQDALQIEIRQGEKFSVRVEGDESKMDLVNIKQNGKEVSFSLDRGPWFGRRWRDERVRVVVRLPRLARLQLEDAARAEFYDVDYDDLSLLLSDAAVAHLRGRVGRLRVALQDAATLTLRGEGDQLTVRLQDASGLKAREFRVRTADVTAQDAASARLYVTEQLDAEATGAGSVRYRGKPQETLIKNGIAAKVRPE